MKIIRLVLLFSGILFVTLTSGCIETDELRSFYITPDGKVDVVIYQDNVHASDEQKGLKDLQDWFKKIKSHQSDEVRKPKLDRMKKTSEEYLFSIDWNVE